VERSAPKRAREVPALLDQGKIVIEPLL
jgi:hypothetical protein